MEVTAVQEIKDFVASKVDEKVTGPIKALETQVVEQVKGVDAKVGEMRKELEELKAKAATGIQVVKDEADRPFKSFGEQLMSVVQFSKGMGQMDPRLKAISGASETVNSDGGFLVQQDFAQGLVKRAYETGVLASRCMRLGVSANSNGVKINAIDETSRAAGSRWGGISVSFIEEAGTVTASKPKFRTMELSLKKMMGLCYATDELLADAGALAQVVEQGFAEEIAFVLDDKIFQGTGAGCPLGVLNANCLVSVSKETGQAAATVVAENIIKMRARLWARSRANAVWLVNQDVEPLLHQMSLPVGTGGLPVFLPANGLSGLPYDTLYGRPVIPIEQCQTVGTVGDIVLGDFSQYILADKGGVQSDVSVHVRFLNDEQVFRFIYRVDGQPIWNAALTPAHGTNTLSPFVALAVRA